MVNDQTLFERLYFIQNATGGVMGPWESFLCSRGLKTLELRVREQVAHGAAGGRTPGRRTAACDGVYYPGLPRIRGTGLPPRQMEGAFGAMLSFEVDGELAAGGARGRRDAAVSPGREPGGGRIV